VELDEFIEVHYAGLLRTAFLLTGDRHAAEDLLQEVLAKSWAYARRSRIEQPGAFIRRCLVNQYVSQWRRRGRLWEEPTAPTDLPERLMDDASEGLGARDAMS